MTPPARPDISWVRGATPEPTREPGPRDDLVEQLSRAHDTLQRLTPERERVEVPEPQVQEREDVER